MTGYAPPPAPGRVREPKAAGAGAGGTPFSRSVRLAARAAPPLTREPAECARLLVRQRSSHAGNLSTQAQRRRPALPPPRAASRLRQPHTLYTRNSTVPIYSLLHQIDHVRVET